MRQYIDNETAKRDAITIVTVGLTHDEENQIRALIKSIERKRSHEKRSRLLHNIIFGN
ncbi:hypothetical protein LY28_01319 [Ruminiclostridium sufflavum DSM 19573]|uniref:Uncharacterized protein n=1 Tax=Ruminiclostridium sufflavum DSM 19573 TaxID=1121337 RepID=A0A318XZN8_9FIRM|nr:hypothetical protein [Ruminiclostridium sufflavum]PYG88470.1 hypothetical protein LY28_01319 [Ruminiclostridium sufflavum DSM 19573]